MLIYSFTCALSFLICFFARNKIQHSIVWSGSNVIYKPDSKWLGKKYLYLNKTVLVCMIAAFIPAIVAGIRYKVGTDYVDTYAAGYEKVLNNDDSHGFEIGYLLLNKIIQLFGFEYYAVFLITSFIFVMFTYAGIANTSENIRMSIVLFFLTRYYFIGLNCVRQLIALSIALYSLKYVLKTDFMHFLVFITVAISFHYTTIIFLPVYFLYKFKINSICKFLLFSSFIVISVIMKPVCLIIFQGTKYYRIFLTYDNAGIKFTLFTIGFNLLLLAIFGLARRKNKSDKRLNLFYNIQLVATLLTFLLQSLPVVERLYWIYSFPVIATLPYAFKKIRNVNLRYLLEIIVISLYIFYFVYDIIVLKDHGVLPYRTIFQSGMN